MALLREESRRKGKRIAQLEDLLAELEKDYRTVRARLSSLDSSVEAAHEPLPAFAASVVDAAVESAVASSTALLNAGVGTVRHRAVDETRYVYSEGYDEDDEEDDDDRDGLGARQVRGVRLDHHVRAGANAPDDAVDEAVWSADRWVASLGVPQILAASLLRHLRVLRQVARHHRRREPLLLHEAVVQRAVRRARACARRAARQRTPLAAAVPDTQVGAVAR